MSYPKGIWLCPYCETGKQNCKLCDGYGFITELEMSFLEGNLQNSTQTYHFNSPGVLTLDLDEFEQKVNR